MINRICWTLIIVFLSVTAGLAGVPETVVVSGSGIAVIVNSDNPVDKLSLADLQRIVLGERRSWNARIPLVLMMRSEGSRERVLLLKKACHMTDAEYHQYWTGKIFRGDVTSEPVSLPSLGTALDFVSSIKGGISFVDAASVRPGIKVIRIDGHLPGEQGYPIQ
jgi:ABC-type phosphate transport system substrate-binding protein